VRLVLFLLGLPLIYGTMHPGVQCDVP
jgi:hypothetical protein